MKNRLLRLLEEAAYLLYAAGVYAVAWRLSRRRRGRAEGSRRRGMRGVSHVRAAAHLRGAVSPEE